MIELKRNKTYRLLTVKPFTSKYGFYLVKTKIRQIILQRRFWFFGWRWKTVDKLKVTKASIDDAGWLTLNFE